MNKFTVSVPASAIGQDGKIDKRLIKVSQDASEARFPSVVVTPEREKADSDVMKALEKLTEVLKQKPEGFRPIRWMVAIPKSAIDEEAGTIDASLCFPFWEMSEDAPT